MAGVREAGRAQTTAAILAAARQEIAQHGGAGLSMRAVAREVGLVSSAVYRYFPTREALLTAMIMESYGNLEAALRRVDAGRADQRWRALGCALRAWAQSAPHEFQLIYGTPVPGYAAPVETVPAAALVAQHFLEVGARRGVGAYSDPALGKQMATALALVPDGEPSGAAAVLAELAALVGLVGLELAGHFVGTADPADRLYAALLDRQVATLALAGPGVR